MRAKKNKESLAFSEEPSIKAYRDQHSHCGSNPSILIIPSQMQFLSQLSFLLPPRARGQAMCSHWRTTSYIVVRKVFDVRKPHGAAPERALVSTSIYKKKISNSSLQTQRNYSFHRTTTSETPLSHRRLPISLSLTSHSAPDKSHRPC